MWDQIARNGIKRTTLSRTGYRTEIGQWLRRAKRDGWEIQSTGIGWEIHKPDDWACIIAAGSYFRFRAATHRAPVPDMSLEMPASWRSGYIRPSCGIE